ncbi:branched-chain amino acid ABC transporter ATP-binding protein/permease [Candidatus Raskinella chloraquaticus]|uniref:ABC transporter n=1 Tax=Candidatus Raskinella chloraquaticus TaxID=1951219 RepID=A0A1W9HUT6_9HYPH|nr:MAG: ABC transporter [Proteobacteria bacterium SG_bin8]
MKHHLTSGAILCALLAGSLWLVATGEDYTIFIIALVALTAVAGIGLNVLTGLSGQVSFGHVGFYSIGAYAVGVLALKGVSLWIAVPVAGIVAAALGSLLALPALRVSGPYLGMMTIAFAFIVEHVTIEWRQLTGGQNGLIGIPQPTLVGGLSGERAIAFLAVILCAVSLIFFRLIAAGRWGKAMIAVRDSEIAAASIGLSVTRIKTLAFTISALLTGMAGGIFALLLTFIAPSAFPFSQSILFLLSVIVGGAGWTLGPLIGAGVTVVLPELISWLAEYRLLAFSALLLIVLWLAPEGIIGALARFLPPGKSQRPNAGNFSIALFLARPDHSRGLEVRRLSISFGGIMAAQAIDFSARASRITGLIGPNGAGKTTVLNLVSGFYSPDHGDILLDGHDVTRMSPEQLARRGMARTYQTTQLFSSLSVIDNVLIAMRRGRLGVPWLGFANSIERAQAEGLLAFVGYDGDLGTRAGALAHVDRRLVEIARALAMRPSVLLLDEPAAGLDSRDKAHLGLVLQALSAAGLAVLLVEHDMPLVMEICDSLIVLDAGCKIASGKPADIVSNSRVRAAYLGTQTTAFGKRKALPPADQPVILKVDHLGAGYGSLDVLHDVSFSVGAGEMIAILGSNGAGKSTTMRALSGLNSPKEGHITFNGQAIANKPAHEIVRCGLVLVPEGRQIFPELSVADNLRLGAYCRKDDRIEADMAAVLARFPRLSDRINGRAGLLSGGEAQMLAVARALMGRPRLLLLDEPSLGLAPRIVEGLYGVLGQLRDDGMTILIVDQMAHMALQLADRGYLISNGRIIRQATASALLDDPSFEAVYLGQHTPSPHGNLPDAG